MFRFLILSVLLQLASFLSSAAHQIDMVEMKFVQENDQWKLVGYLDVGYMIPEIRRLVEAPPVMREEVMNGTPEFHQKIIRDTRETMRWLIVLRYNGEEIPWEMRFPDFEGGPLDLRVEASGWAMIRAEIYTAARPGPGELTVSWYDELQCTLVITHPKTADRPASAVSLEPRMSATLLVLKADQTSPPETTNRREQAENWLISGFRHVIPLGLDHLLFILGLFLLVPRWKPLLGQSLLFTLAHSVTLALCVFGWIVLPSRLVEVLIAASIAWIGIENLIIRELKPSRLFLVFGFGLIHGMGFANVLREKITGLTGGELALPLIGFNLGVELAQIAVLAVAFAVCMPFQKWTGQIRVVGSIMVALAGLFWMFERIFTA